MAFEGIKARLAAARERRPLLDHAIRTFTHYGGVKGNQQAGGVTYFGFLSVFPVLALAFFAVGYVARVYPDANDTLVKAIEEVLPGLVGNDEGQVSLTEVEDAAGAVGLVGLLGVLYAGLGWLSALRDALIVIFEEPTRLQPSFVVGKLRDLVTLVLLGVVLGTSVVVSGVVTRFSEEVLDWLGLGSELGWLIAVLAVLLGLLAGTVLFFAMFTLLAKPPTPRRALWQGALLGAVGFELLKQLSSVLLASTEGQPAFQVFGIALILLVWINYFSRVTLYAAAWAHTSPAARAARDADPENVQGPPSPPLEVHEERTGRLAAPAQGRRPRWAAPLAIAGAVAALAALRKKKDR